MDNLVTPVLNYAKPRNMVNIVFLLTYRLRKMPLKQKLRKKWDQKFFIATFEDALYS